MIRNIIILGVIILSSVIVGSCSQDEHIPLNDRYISIRATSSESKGPIYSDREFIGEYLVEFSSQPINEELVVEYKLVPGDDLEADRDFKLLNSDNGKLVFPKGIYAMPIRIKWLSTVVREDPSNPASDIISDTLEDGENDDPTLRITLVSNSLNITNEGWNSENFPREIKVYKRRAEQ